MTAPISNGPATTRLHHYAGHYCDLLLWSFGPEGTCRYFLKVSNCFKLGEYPEKLGFVGPFPSPFSHWRGRGRDGWKLGVLSALSWSLMQ